MIGGIRGIGYSVYGYSFPFRTSAVRGTGQADAVENAQSAARTGASESTQGTARAVAAQGAQPARVGARVTGIPAAQPDTPVQPINAVDAVASDAPLDRASLLFQMETDPVAMAVRSRIRYLDGSQDAIQANFSLADAQDVTDAGEQPLLYGTSAESALLGQLPGARAEELQTPLLFSVDEADSFPQLPGMDEEDGFPQLGVGGERVTPEQQDVAGAAADLPGQTEGVGTSDNDMAAESVKGGRTKSAQEIMEEGECQTCKNRKYQDGSDDPGVSFKTPTTVAPELAASAVRGHENEHVVRERAQAEREDRKVVSQTVTYHTEICPECGKAYVAGGTTRTVTAANPEPEQQAWNEKQEKNDEPTTAMAAFLGVPDAE